MRLALNDSWTQAQIADSCRTQQSIVSAWKSGAKKGDEEQLKPLLEIYGPKLRRKSFRLYQSINNEAGSIQYTRVEGAVLISHLIIKEADTYPRTKPSPWMKITVHTQGNGEFRLITQRRFENQTLRTTVECADEQAIWDSLIGEKITYKELLELVDSISSKLKQEQEQEQVHESITLPFLIRKALLNAGYPVEDVVDLPSA